MGIALGMARAFPHMLNTPLTKGKVPPPNKRDVKHRFRLEIVHRKSVAGLFSDGDSYALHVGVEREATDRIEGFEET